MARLTWLLISSYLAITATAGWTQISLTEWEDDNGLRTQSAYPKYFHEAKGFEHYDQRYMTKELKQAEAIKTTQILVQTYLATMRDLGVQTWLMHGSLLGWWWGKKIMPWDKNPGVQITEADLYYLAAHYNMSTHYYQYGDMEQGKSFLLDINAHYDDRQEKDLLNGIDARWIDMETGLFIDVTSARYHSPDEYGEGSVYEKRGNRYRDSHIFPLRKTSYEGVTAWIPFRYKEFLTAEYGEEALTTTTFNNHKFDKNEMRWVSRREGSSSGMKDNYIDEVKEKWAAKQTDSE